MDLDNEEYYYNRFIKTHISKKEVKEKYIKKDKLKEKIKKARCYAWHNKDDEYWAKVIIDSFEELLEEK